MTVIELRNVSKKYTLRFGKGALIKEFFPRLISPSIKRDFWALREVNLKVEEGEVLGIIGDNGAGKTTLLSIIAKITFPTEGRVYTRGRIYPLLTLGAGFHRELSGEDNIYLNGLLLGLSLNQIKERIEEIIEFSGLGSFIKMPIYTYSSGMLLRLGFAIAVHVDFDILLLDEVLAVGDLSFQERCINKIKEFIREGKTIIICSQALDLIEELCSKVILLEGGKIVAEGAPSEAIKIYKELKDRKSKLFDYMELVRSLPEDIQRIKSCWGKKEGDKVEILEVNLQNGTQGKHPVKTGEPLLIWVRAKVKERLISPHFGIAIFRDDYHYCHGPNTKFDGIKIKEVPPKEISFGLYYPKFLLGDGSYKISIAIWDEEERNPYLHHCACYELKVSNPVPLGHLADLDFDYRFLGKGAPIKEGRMDFDQLREGDFFGVGRISSFEICDGRFQRKDVFLTGEDLNIKLVLELREEGLVGIRIFRSTGILCHSFCFLFPPGIWKVLFRYPRLSLLRGEYLINALLCKDNKIYDKKGRRFTVLSFVQDHGIIYMEHNWRLEL